MKSVLYLSLLALGILLACSTPKEEGEIRPEVSKIEADLRDIWVLTSFLDELLDSVSFPDEIPRLELKPSQSSVIGYTGCNHLNGSFEADESGKLKFGPIATTKKYCFEAPEALFLDYLIQTVEYKRVGLKLEFWNDSARVLTFKKVD